jgi:polar amino acid transport system substrate-binding protein
MSRARTVLASTARALLCLLPLLLLAPAAGARPLRLASDDWCPYVCTNSGSPGGYLVDLAGLALEAEGYQAQALSMPLSRALSAARKGEIDGVYAPALDAPLRMSAVLTRSRACFYTLAEDDWSYAGLASLQGRVLGVIEDYGYDDGPMDGYIRQEHGSHRSRNGSLEISYGQTAGQNNLQKLLHRRFPVLLEHEAVMKQLLAKENAVQRVRRAGCLEKSLPLVVGFSPAAADAPAWIAALARGVRKLEASGQARALRQRYGVTEDGAQP